MLSTFKAGQQSTVIPTAPQGIVFPGDAGVPQGLIQPTRTTGRPASASHMTCEETAERPCEAPMESSMTALNADIIQNVGQPWRYTFTIQAPPSLVDPLRGQPPIPTGVNRTNPVFTGIQDLAFADPNFRTGYVHNYNVNVQQQIGRDLAVQVGYVGRLARKLVMGLAANPAINGPGATLNNLNARRLYPGFGDLRSISSLANASYNGLQIEGTKRYSRGFSIQGAYTWSRAIDMRSAVAAVGAATPDVFNLATEYGLSDFHAAHVANISWLWEIPARATPAGSGMSPGDGRSTDFGRGVPDCHQRPFRTRQRAHRDNESAAQRNGRPDALVRTVRAHSSLPTGSTERSSCIQPRVSRATWAATR